MKFGRVLVVDPSSANAKMLANLLRNLKPACQVYGAQSSEQAMLLARELNPDLIFVESSAPGFDGMALTRGLRRSELLCREAPIVMVLAAATASVIRDARDSGVHEFLRRPFTLGDLEKRIEVVSGKPRDWIEAITYVGPDRRRFASADYDGPRKRRNDGPSRAQKINQALRIVKSAVGAVDSEPVQAARALATQARILTEVTSGHEKLKKLAGVTAQLQAYLTAAALANNLAKDQVQVFAQNLIAAAPPETRPTDEKASS